MSTKLPLSNFQLIACSMYIHDKVRGQYSVIYSTVFNCIVLYFVALYCIVVYCIVLYCIILYYIVWYWTVFSFSWYSAIYHLEFSRTKTKIKSFENQFCQLGMQLEETFTLTIGPLKHWIVCTGNKRGLCFHIFCCLLSVCNVFTTPIVVSQVLAPSLFILNFGINL